MIKENNKEKFVNNVFVVCVFSALAGILVTVACILVFSVFGVVFDLGDGFAVAAACISPAGGSFFAGYICLRKNKQRGLFYGSICGFLIFVLMLAVSLIISRGGFTLATLFHLIICVISGCIGGIISANRHEKRKII